MATTQSSIDGHYSGNNGNNNIYGSTVNNYNGQVPSYVPTATFEELIARNGWGTSPPEIDLDHLRDEYNLPLADTGKWIFEDAGYREWRESSESKLLWLCGSPGTGKTMLAKRVAAEFLKELGDSSNGVKLVFHFVSPKPPTDGNSADEDRLSQLRLAKVASDLLYSILQQDGKLFDGCKAALKKQGNGFFTNPSSLWKVLQKAIKDCQIGPVYILIDGVDRLKGSLCKELIGRTLGLMKICTVKIFLSSRDAPHTSNNLPHNLHECTKINLDTSNLIKEDVDTFIRHSVNAWGWDEALRERAIGELLARSEGIFLWASLAIGSLTDHSSGSDFDKSLMKLQSGLEDIYREMLSTLCAAGVSREVLSTIWCTALALRPLTFGELGYILVCIEERTRAKQQPSHGGTGSEIRSRTEEEIRMHVQSSRGFLRATNTSISILHHTAIDYLFDEKRKDGLPVLSKGEADLTISRECFRCLHHAFGDPERFPRREVSGRHNRSGDSDLGQDHQEDEPEETPWEVARRDPSGAVAKWPFIRYAAESWFIHARRGFKISNVKFYDNSTCNWLQHQFFETSDVIRKPWIQLCGDPKMEILAGEQTPLHIAACLGLLPLTQRVLKGLWEQMNNPPFSWFLGAKVLRVKYDLSITEGAPSLIIDQDQYGNTPPPAAAISGNSPQLEAAQQRTIFVRPLNKKTLDKKNCSGNTPLHLALLYNHIEIAELLLKKGAEPPIKNGVKVTAPKLETKLGRGASRKPARGPWSGLWTGRKL